MAPTRHRLVARSALVHAIHAAQADRVAINRGAHALGLAGVVGRHGGGCVVDGWGVSRRKADSRVFWSLFRVLWGLMGREDVSEASR